MSVGSLDQPRATTQTAPVKKPGVRWVGAPDTGQWVDEDGNPAASPTVGTQTQAASPPKIVNDLPEGAADVVDSNGVRHVPTSRGTSGSDGAWMDATRSSSNNPKYGGVGGNAPAPSTPAAPAPPPAPDGLSDAAARARQLADDAMNRHTDPGTITASTAGGPTVDKTGTTQAGVNVQVAPRTTVPNPIQVDRIGGVPVNNVGPITADKVWSPEISQSGTALQLAAAGTYQDILAGRAPSVAEQQLKAAQDRAAAEQLSIAAGARGQGVASARRNAATNIGLQQMEAGGQLAELRAKEIADAAAGLSSTGGAVQGENLTASGQLIDTQKTNAVNALEASKTNAANTIDVGKTNAANAIDVQKSNQATDLAAKQATAANQLKADLSSDDRLQTSLNLAAELAQRAQAGDQSAAVQLNSLGAQLQTDVGKFNANQIQTADASNIENRLRAMGMDEAYTAQMTALWVQAENSKDQVALEKLKVQLQQQAAENQKKGGILGFVSNILGTAASFIPGIGPLVGAGIKAAIDSGHSSPDGNYDVDADGNAVDANGDPIVMSDRRLKQDVEAVDPKDVDEFLRTVGKTQSWEYKPGEGLPPGRKMGPMAQDLAADKLASEAVGTRSDGKMSLDYQHLAALALAGVGRLNDRVEAVEAARPRGKGRGKADVKGFVMAVKGPR